MFPYGSACAVFFPAVFAVQGGGGITQTPPPLKIQWFVPWGVFNLRVATFTNEILVKHT